MPSATMNRQEGPPGATKSAVVAELNVSSLLPFWPGVISGAGPLLSDWRPGT